MNDFFKNFIQGIVTCGLVMLGSAVIADSGIMAIVGSIVAATGYAITMVLDMVYIIEQCKKEEK